MNNKKEVKPKRKQYSADIESRIRGTLKHSQEEIKECEEYFWYTEKRLNKKISEDQTFEVGQNFYFQENRGKYSRSCTLFTITAVEETFLVIKLLGGSEDVLIRGNYHAFNQASFIDEDFYVLSEWQEEKYKGINIKKSLEVCGYDPRDFEDRILAYTKIIGHCEGCNSENEGFLSHYYDRKKPHYFGRAKDPCDWHL